MTIQEWLTEWRDILNEQQYGKHITKNVERIASIYQDSDNHNHILGNSTDNSDIESQYRAFLTDPRRI